MSSLKQKIGKKIKRIRGEKGITQEQLAEKARISVDFLSLIERGRNAPSLGTLEKLSKALSISASDLLKNTDE